MAKPEPEGVAFPFPVSFRAYVGLSSLTGCGVWQYIGVCSLFWVCCRGVVCVCKGVGVEGKSNIGNGCKCGIYIRVIK